MRCRTASSSADGVPRRCCSGTAAGRTAAPRTGVRASCCPRCPRSTPRNCAGSWSGCGAGRAMPAERRRAHLVPMKRPASMNPHRLKSAAASAGARPPQASSRGIGPPASSTRRLRPEPAAPVSPTGSRQRWSREIPPPEFSIHRGILIRPAAPHVKALVNTQEAHRDASQSSASSQVQAISLPR